MEAANTFLSDETEIENLVATESHDENRILLLAINIDVLDRHHSSVLLIRGQLDVVRSHVAVLLIWRALFIQAIVYRTVITEVLTLAITMG